MFFHPFFASYIAKPSLTTALSLFLLQISLTNTVPLTHIDQDEIKAVLAEYKLNSCDIAIRQPEATLEDLIDVIEGNRSALFPLFTARSRCDASSNFASDILLLFATSSQGVRSRSLRSEQDRRHLN